MTDDTTVAGDEGATENSQPLLKPSLTQFPWVRAAGASLALLIVQYAALVASVTLTSVTVTRPEWELWTKAVQYGFVLYSAHHIPIATTINTQLQTGTSLNNLLYGPSLYPAVLFFLLPIVALTVAGYLFERRRTPPASVAIFEESTMVGTGFTIPYVLAGVIGSFVFVRRISTETAQASSAPALLWTLVAMFLFPMVFVALGAMVAYRRGDPDQA